MSEIQGGSKEHETSTQTVDFAGTVGNRCKHIVGREYVTLAFEESTGDPAVAGPLDIRDDP